MPGDGHGLEGFVADLAGEGLEATVEGGVVTYEVVSVGGPWSGQQTATGVSVEELQGWPLAPPHWIHLPEAVAFASTNADRTGTLPGYARHSRDIGQWDLSRRPILSWLAHVRAVVGQAV